MVDYPNSNQWQPATVSGYEAALGVCPPARKCGTIFACGEPQRHAGDRAVHAIFGRLGSRQFCKLDFLDNFNGDTYLREMAELARSERSATVDDDDEVEGTVDHSVDWATAVREFVVGSLDIFTDAEGMVDVSKLQAAAVIQFGLDEKEPADGRRVQLDGLINQIVEELAVEF